MALRPRTRSSSPFGDTTATTGWKPSRPRPRRREGVGPATPDGDPTPAVDEQPTTGIAPRGSATPRKI